MISVSVDFRKARSRTHDKDGVVYFRIYGPVPEGVRSCLTVNTYLRGRDRSAMESHRDEILRLIRVVYDIVEGLVRSGEAVWLGRVVESFRALMKDGKRRQELLPVLDPLSPMRSDLFSVGSSFRRHVRLLSPPQHSEDPEVLDLLSFIRLRSLQCRSEKRLSTSRSYTSLQRELRSFLGHDVLPWTDVDAPFIRKFASRLVERGFKASTQGYYLGMLRTLLFHATEQGYCSVRPEWFRSVPTQGVPGSRDRVRCQIGLDAIKRICLLNLQASASLSLVRDLFMFAFYCRGMELVDVAHLTRRNLHGDMLVYRRRQTGREVRVPIEREAMSILRRYDTGGAYLFPLLDSSMSSQFPTRRTWVGYHLKVIGRLAGVPGLTFSHNIEAWSTVFSNMPITEKFFTAIG